MIGRLPASRQVRLCIGLQLRNPDQLDALLYDLYDPASPRYHHFLTPEQFNAAFAPTEQDYAAVVEFARAHGLSVSSRLPDRRMVDVVGSAASIERAFHVHLHEYRHASRSRSFYAPDAEPSVASTLKVADVWGLSDYPEPRALHGTPRPLGTTAQPNGTGSASGMYIGGDFRKAYLPGVTNLTGAGQVVALFQLDGFYASDIAAYAVAASNAQVGVPAVPLQTVLIDGFSGNVYDSNGNGEVSLDIEMAMSMAPGLSRIIVYEGNPTNFYPAHVISQIAAENLARQVSCSWAWSGGPNATFDSYLQQLIAQGQSFFQASGDSDAYTTGYIDNTANNTSPVDSLYLTCVGGTTLTTSSGAWQSETVWNWDTRGSPGVGSSGGSSSYYAIPSWQSTINMTNNHGSVYYRNIPDVALTAENIYVRYGNGLIGNFGGTSCAAPLWAGLCALVNQQAAINAVSPVGFLNPAIYSIGKGAGYTTAFHDITTGSNTRTGVTNFYAMTGYDLCTGWGTPRGSNLINSLMPFNALRVTPVTTPAFIGPVGGPFSPTPNAFTLANAGASSMNWSAGTTSTWFTLVPSNGTLLAGGTTNVTITLAAQTTGLVAQVYSGTAWITNTLDGALQSRSVSLLVGQPVVLNGGFETGDQTSWSKYGNFDYNAPVNANYTYNGDPGSYFVHSGTYGFYLGAAGSLGFISQTLQTVSNRPYLLSFWLRNPYYPCTPNEFVVQWGGTTLMDQTNMPVFEWTNVQFVVVANAPSVALAFGGRNDPNEFALDDISAQMLTTPTVGTFGAGTNMAALAWNASTNVHYQWQYTTNLVPAQWVNLGAPVLGTGGTMVATDASPAGTQRFYRVILQP